jgi:hypothetical protein
MKHGAHATADVKWRCDHRKDIAVAFEEKVEVFIPPGWFILAFAVK